MRLTVVGCAGSFPTPRSAASCYLLEHDGARLVLDLGNGAFGQLQRYVDLAADDALAGLVLTHCHVDHCADVGPLYVHRRYRPTPPKARLPILGPHEARDRLTAIYGPPVDLDAQFAFATFGPDPTVIGPFEISAVRAAHPVEAYSVRVQAGGRSVTYSGDTGPTDALAELARDTDVALFEASFTGPTSPPDLHLRAAEAGQIAARAGAAMLILTHLVTWPDAVSSDSASTDAVSSDAASGDAGRTVADTARAEAAATFAGPLRVAVPGLTLDLA